MQVTIDLGTFFDQDSEVIGAEVLNRLTEMVMDRTISPETHYEARQMVEKVLTEQVREGVHAKVKEIVEAALDDEFTIVTGYGEVGKKTTIRQQIKEQIDGALAAITGGNRNSYPNDMQKRWRDLIDGTVREVVLAGIKPFVGELRAKYEKGFQEALDNALLSVKAPRR